MNIRLFKSMWGFTGDNELAVEQTIAAGMAGIEGPAPENQKQRIALRQLLSEHNLEYIAEITTAGSYVPDRRATLQEHIDSFKAKLDQSLALDPVFITCLGGCDAWPETQSLEFFSRAMELAGESGATVSFETHRGRSLFNPWITQRVVETHPGILLTCDFSHWCVVCERLIDTEMDVIHRIADNAHHIHARVGYDQGPQVPNPAAPEYQPALRAHQRWWEIIWESQKRRGYRTTTMTPEFGPDGYLHEAPFTREPVADLLELNSWMANEEREHFARFQQ